MDTIDGNGAFPLSQLENISIGYLPKLETTQQL